MFTDPAQDPQPLSRELICTVSTDKAKLQRCDYELGIGILPIPPDGSGGSSREGGRIGKIILLIFARSIEVSTIKTARRGERSLTTRSYSVTFYDSR